MTEHSTAQVSTETRDRSRSESLLLRKLPYLALLVLTIAGVAFTSVTHTPLIRYWELLAVASAISIRHQRLHFAL